MSGARRCGTCLHFKFASRLGTVRGSCEWPAPPDAPFWAEGGGEFYRGPRRETTVRDGTNCRAWQERPEDAPPQAYEPPSAADLKKMACEALDSEART